MSLAKQLLKRHSNVDEAQHYNTKVREVESKNGSRKVRLGVKESKRIVGKMLSEGNNFPNPATKKDRKMLEECEVLMHQTMERLKVVKDSKRPMREENIDENGSETIKRMKIFHRFLGELLGEAEKGDMSEKELLRNAKDFPGLLEKAFKADKK